jgi:hypothetical protein
MVKVYFHVGIIVAEHLAHHLKVRGLALLDKMENCLVLWPEVTSTVVDHSSHHPKIKGLIPARLCWHHEKKGEKFSSMDNDGSTVVERLPHHLKVRCLAPLDKMENCLVPLPEVVSQW